MRSNAVTVACRVLLMAAICCISSACQTTGARIDRAGAELGRAEAGINLPAWPAHCRQAVSHAPLTAGADAVATLASERAQLVFANQRAANCGAHYDRLKTGLEAR